MTRGRIAAALIGVNVALALVLALLWLGPGPLARLNDWSAPASQAPSLTDLQAALLRFNPAAAAVYPAVLERPLLQPSRRPEVVAASSPAEPASTALEQLKLLGIVSGPTLTGVLLEDQGKPRFVRRSEPVGDWTFSAIDGRKAVFTKGSERKLIELPSLSAASGVGHVVGAPVGSQAVPSPSAKPQAAVTARPKPPEPPLASPSSTEESAAAPKASEPVAAFGGSVAPSFPAAPSAAR